MFGHIFIQNEYLGWSGIKNSSVMEEYIIALLNANLRVIIPDFGAFIVRQKDPRVIVFNEFLRYNDGLLIDQIAKSEQVEKEIAEQQVSDFAIEASKTLESGKVLKIKGLGSLMREASGKITFTEGPEKVSASGKKEAEQKSPAKPETAPGDAAVSPDTKAKPGSPSAIRTKAKSEKKSETKPEVKPKTKPEPTTEKSEISPQSTSGTEIKPQSKTEPGTGSEPGSEPKTAPETEKKAEAETKAKTVAKREDKAESSTETKTDRDIVPGTGFPGKKIQKEQSPGSSSQVKQPLPGETVLSDQEARRPEPGYSARKSKKSSINQILTIILIFLAANVIVLGWFLYGDQIRSWLGGKHNETLFPDSTVVEQAQPGNEIQAGDSSVMPEPPVSSEATENEYPVSPVTPQSQVVQTSQPKYYIVAGCFREEGNADALVQSLRNKGYDAEKFGTIGNLHAVSYESFQNRSDALSALEQIRQKEQPDAWMTRF